jgi:hypothetical protein
MTSRWLDLTDMENPGKSQFLRSLTPLTVSQNLYMLCSYFFLEIEVSKTLSYSSYRFFGKPISASLKIDHF